MTNLHTSQIVNETLGYGAPNVRTTQQVMESLAAAYPTARVSQLVRELLGSAGNPRLLVSQIVAEILGSNVIGLRATQIFVETLIVNWNNPMLPLYPTLPGLTYDVKWSPEFFNMKTQTTETGADIDLGLAAWPLHNFELTYSVLRDNFNGYIDPDYNGTEFRTMMGFFLMIGGTIGRFLFDNPDDDQVTGQAQFVTDGINSTFGPLQRTFGVADYNATEPVGVVNTGETFNLYLNSTLQDPTTYSVLTAAPCNQQIKFNSTPASGLSATTDMSYYYYCKFPDNTNTFEKFMSQLWLFQKVQLHTCRVGA